MEIWHEETDLDPETQWIDGNQLNIVMTSCSLPLSFWNFGAILGCRCNSSGVQPRSRVSTGRSTGKKACFNSRKAGCRSTTGRQSAEANSTRRDQAGSQKSKKLAGLKSLTQEGVRYRKPGCDAQSKKKTRAGYVCSVGLMGKWATGFHRQVEGDWNRLEHTEDD